MNMTIHPRIRSVLFCFGVTSLLVSIGVLVGVYVRPVTSTDYMQQARDAVPWLLWGMGSAVVGAGLCSFGRARLRTVFVVLSGLMAGVWLLLAGSAV